MSLDLSRISTSSSTSVDRGRQSLGKPPPPFRLGARQPSIDEIASMRPISVARSEVKALGNAIHEVLRAPRPSLDLIWSSKTTAESPQESPMASEPQCAYEGNQVRLLMNTEVEEPDNRAMDREPVKARSSHQAPSQLSTSDISRSPRDFGPVSAEVEPIPSASASSEGSIYSRPSALPALQSGMWGPIRTSRASKGGLLSALRSARPIVTLTPFLKGTPVLSATPPESLGACPIGSSGTLSGDGASSAALSGPPRFARVITGPDTITDRPLEAKQPLVRRQVPSQQEKPSLCEPLLPPRPPEQAAFHPFSHFSLRTMARSTLPEKVSIPFSVPSDTSAAAVSQDIEIDAGQPWAWSCSHPVSPSTLARPKANVKRPNTFEPPPTYSRRRASVLDAHHTQTQQGTRTLLAVQQSCPDPKVFVSGLLGPRGRRLSIVLPPVATISRKTLAVQVVGN